MWRRLVWVLLCAGCASGHADRPETVVIPASTERVGHDDAPPPRVDTPDPPNTGDPYAYFVGHWEGAVNGKLSTELTVNDGGTFHIRLPIQKHRPACDLFGRLRITDKRVYFDIENSTCEAENPGTTLEREVVSKSDDAWVVQSDDGRMVIHYTRSKAQ
jgi:hypothetical protein